MGFLSSVENFLGIGHHQQANAQDASQIDSKPAGGGKYKFQVLVDGDMHIQDLKVGHAWIRLISPQDQMQSWGFWPAKPLNLLTAFKSVPGAVHSPDTSHSPTAIHDWDVDANAAQKVQKAAHDRQASPGDYNLFHRNCVHFSADLCGAAGVSIPAFTTLGIANPSKLAQSIQQLNAKQGRDALEQPLQASAPTPPPTENKG